MSDQQQQQQQTPQQQAGAGDQQQQQPFWHALPENMRGATAEETLQKVMPSWQGYHKSWTEREPALEKGKAFEFDPINDEKIKPYFDSKDPMVKAFADTAAELGLTKKQANGVVAQVLGKLVEGGHMADRFDPVANVKAVAQALGHKDLNDAAKQAIADFETQATAWAQNVAKQWELPEAAAIELESLTLTPGGVALVKALQTKMGQPGFALGGQQAGSGAMTKERLHEMGKDPALDPFSPKYDKAKRAEYDAAWAGFFSKK